VATSARGITGVDSGQAGAAERGHRGLGGAHGETPQNLTLRGERQGDGDTAPRCGFLPRAGLGPPRKTQPPNSRSRHPMWDGGI